MSRNRSRIRVSDSVVRRVISEELHASLDKFSEMLERAHSIREGSMNRRYGEGVTHAAETKTSSVPLINVLQFVQRFENRCKTLDIDVRPLMWIVGQGWTFQQVQRESGLKRETVHNHLKASLAVWGEMSGMIEANGSSKYRDILGYCKAEKL